MTDERFTVLLFQSMISGSVQSFLDVIRNFGSVSFTGENILTAARERGMRLEFYGDRTWLTMFPAFFQRSQAVESFFVSDYTQVCEIFMASCLLLTWIYVSNIDGMYFKSTEGPGLKMEMVLQIFLPDVI